MKGSVLKHLLYVAISLVSCSSDDDDFTSKCYDDRNVVDSYTNIEGVILGPNTGECPVFTIEVTSMDSQGILPLSACNLSNDLQQDGLRVRFSGFLFETFETEDICAFPFEITEIEVVGE